jgi:predicted phosphodiesterase
LRIAVFSDIHGNVRGLDACLADLAQQGGADIIVGAGDFCVGGPRPREVLQRLADLEARCLCGNTDRYVARNHLDQVDPQTLQWQRAQLGDEWLRWLEALPFSLVFGDGADGLLVVHANPLHDDVHVWPDADDAFLEGVLAGVEQRTIAFGHLHVPYVRLWRDRMLVNVASAGLPKDGDPRASYALFTQRSGGWQVKHRRVVFDIAEVAREMRSSGMPHAEAQVEVLLRHRYEQIGGVVP